MIVKPRNAPFIARIQAPPDLDVTVLLLDMSSNNNGSGPHPTTYSGGMYWASLTAPAVAGMYAIAWMDADEVAFAEQLQVTNSEWIPAPEPEPTAPSRLLASVTQLEARLNVQGGDVETELLEELLEAASERVRDLTGRQFLPTPALPDDDPVVRTVSAFGSRICQARDLRNVEVISADGVDVTGQVRLISIDDHPAHLIRLPRPADQVTITGWFGFAAVPPSIRDAVLGWAQRAYHETRARMGDSVVDPDGGIQTYFRSVPTFVSGPASSFRIDGL